MLPPQDPITNRLSPTTRPGRIHLTTHVSARPKVAATKDTKQGEAPTVRLQLHLVRIPGLCEQEFKSLVWLFIYILSITNGVLIILNESTMRIWCGWIAITDQLLSFLKTCQRGSVWRSQVGHLRCTHMGARLISHRVEEKVECNFPTYFGSREENQGVLVSQRRPPWAIHEHCHTILAVDLERSTMINVLITTWVGRVVISNNIPPIYKLLSFETLNMDIRNIISQTID